jgi:hypothetical protein
VPPAVALLNYISCGILRRIFCQTGIFAGFSLRKSFTSLVGSVQLWWQGTIYFLASLVHWEITRGPILCFFAGFFLYFILQKEERSCDEQVGGRGALYFLVCRIPYKGAMDEARGGEYYISKPLLYSGKIYAFGSRVAHLGWGVAHWGTVYPEGAA